MTISEILGCASAANQRLKHDRYLTPAWCTQALARVEAEHWPDTLWEPCSGEGNIAKVLSEYVSVVESDLIPWQHIRQLDFLKTTNKLAPGIVTNPPFRHATKFIRHAIKLGVSYHAWLLKGDFMCAEERLELVTEFGYPARIWALTSRPDFRKQGAPPMNCAWFVFDGVNKTHSRFEILSR